MDARDVFVVLLLGGGMMLGLIVIFVMGSMMVKDYEGRTRKGRD